LQLCW